MRDGKPRAESVEHRQAMTYAIFALQIHFRNHADVLVSGNDFVHFVEGDRRRYFPPDCYVVFGVYPNKSRDNFKTWEDEASPAVVFKFTSKETKREDIGSKRRDYEQFLKTPEYYLFDPKGEYLKPRLQELILEDGTFRDLALDQNNRLYSPALDLYLGYEGEQFRFYDPKTGIALISPEEEHGSGAERAERQLRLEHDLTGEAKRQVRIEQSHAELAETEMAKLRAEIVALRQK